MSPKRDSRATTHSKFMEPIQARKEIHKLRMPLGEAVSGSLGDKFDVENLGKQLKEEEKAEEKDDDEVWDFDVKMKDLLDLLQSRYFVGEDEKASATFQILEGLLNEDKTWTTCKHLMDRVMTIQAEIIAKVPHETTPRNVIYKFRRIVLDEFMSAIKDYIPIRDIDSPANYFNAVSRSQEMATLDMPAMPQAADELLISRAVKTAVIDVVMEYRMELENIPSEISKQGENIIQEGDVVLTHSFSPTTARLLRQAALTVNYSLYIVESQPFCYGHLTLQELADQIGGAVNATVVADSSVAPLLQHTVTKVLLPAVAVLPDGDLKTHAFGATIATIASLYGKQVYAIAATYQFCVSSVEWENQELCPSLLAHKSQDDVVYSTCKYDRTSASSVHRIVTNGLTCTPRQVARVVGEQYGSHHAREQRKKKMLALTQDGITFPTLA